MQFDSSNEKNQFGFILFFIEKCVLAASPLSFPTGGFASLSMLYKGLA
jgi:hypothetical protein